MLKRLAGNDDIDRAIGKWDSVGISEHDIDAGPRRQISPYISKGRPRKNLPIAAVDVGTAHIQHDSLRSRLKRPARNIPRVTAPHVFHR